jgi:hypothetical protein
MKIFFYLKLFNSSFVLSTISFQVLRLKKMKARVFLMDLKKWKLECFWWNLPKWSLECFITLEKPFIYFFLANIWKYFSFENASQSQKQKLENKLKLPQVKSLKQNILNKTSNLNQYSVRPVFPIIKNFGLI